MVYSDFIDSLSREEEGEEVNMEVGNSKPEASTSSVDGPARLDPMDYPTIHYVGGVWYKRLNDEGGLMKLQEQIFLPQPFVFLPFG